MTTGRTDLDRPRCSVYVGLSGAVCTTAGQSCTEPVQPETIQTCGCGATGHCVRPAGLDAAVLFSAGPVSTSAADAAGPAQLSGWC